MARPGNSNLHDSSRNKQDEFYTDLSLIEDELRHYRHHFKGKRVLCNCDDPWESNFFKYFAMNFNALGLKSLTATCYAASPFAQLELDLFGAGDGDECLAPSSQSPQSPGIKTSRTSRSSRETIAAPAGRCAKQAYKIVIAEVKDENCDGRVDLADVEWLVRNRRNVLTKLAGDGDFRSPECVALLKDADIVVTNPPFSLFREYIAQLMEHGKQFLIIGNINNVTYSDVTPLFMQKKVWLGYKSGHFWFRVPDHYDEKSTDFKIDINGQKWRRMGNICWFTNLEIGRRHEDIVLFRHYDAHQYPKYENFDAIHVAKTADIPNDYFGIMGVPITFVAQHNPEQFDLLGIDKDFTTDGKRFVLSGKQLYAHLVIRRRK